MGSESYKFLHVFLVSFPGQGHFNPLLRFSKLLASRGLLATLSAPELIGKGIREANNIVDDQLTPVGDGFIRFEFFDDKSAALETDAPFDVYLNHLEVIGRQKLPQMLKKHEEQGRPVSCLIVNPFLPWVSDVAENLNIPSATLWIQSCASFSLYYYYHNNLLPFPSETEPEIDVQLPGGSTLPLLKYDEIPSFLHPSSPYKFLATAALGQFKNLSKNFCVLMDTFLELEREEIESISKLCSVKPIGPLFKATRDYSNTITGDMIKASECKEWLDSKPPSSVVYISFGSVVFLKQEQVTEIAHGLLNSGVSFLWVIRPPPNKSRPPHVLPEGFLEKVGDNGKIVQWSPQEQVLAHQSIACFVTHCGWNSTLEAISSGVPVVAFPQWGDQVTDAKYLVDVFKVGVRMCRGEAENKIVQREDVEKCLREATSGPKAEEIRENACRWKKKAEEAVAKGGSSDKNILEFLDEITKKCTV